MCFNYITRKSFLKKASLLTLGFSGLSNYLLSQTIKTINNKSIELIKDPNGIIDLPKGFEYKVISEFGDKMSDNLQVPDHADGMGCFKGEKNQIILIRNHEIGRFEQYEFKHEYKKIISREKVLK